MQRKENTRPHKGLRTNVHGSLIHNSCRLDTNQMPQNKGTDKQSMIQPHDGTLLSKKKERTTDRHKDMDESRNYYAERKDTRVQTVW